MRESRRLCVKMALMTSKRCPLLTSTKLRCRFKAEGNLVVRKNATNPAVACQAISEDVRAEADGRPGAPLARPRFLLGMSKRF